MLIKKVAGAFAAAGLIGSIPAAEIEVLYSGIVNDTVVNAQTPMGLMRDAKGNYVTAFIDGGDVVAGSTTYFSRTADLGKTWQQPFSSYRPEKKEVGNAMSFTQLKDGRVLGVDMNVYHTDLSQEGFKSYRYSIADVIEIDPATGERKFIFRLKTPGDSVCSPMGNNIVELSNGELLLPAYVFCYNAPTDKDFPYGSGLFRSKDGGKTWGDFELIFREPDPEDVQGFNESTIFEMPNGDLIAYARIDTHPPKHTWKAYSKDKGKTWSDPVKTDLAIVYPVGIKTSRGDYLMVAGNRFGSTYRITTVFYSKDGDNFQAIGTPKYSRPGNGKPHNSATGGSQNIMEIAPDTFLITFYSADPVLPGRDSCYIDSCVFKLIR